jgi:hypothetical protein
MDKAQKGGNTKCDGTVASSEHHRIGNSCSLNSTDVTLYRTVDVKFGFIKKKHERI